jgi:uncharacterized protein (DUF302 family)
MRAVAVCLALVAALPLGQVRASEPPPKSNGSIVRYVVDKPFSDVIFELNFAITERNLRITGRNTIGEGLRKRGYKDFPDIEVIHFCSLELAREVLLIDPGFVAQMPCRIAVHEEGGKTVISLITLPLDHHDARVNEFAERMNAILTEIVAFTLETSGD